MLYKSPQQACCSRHPAMCCMCAAVHLHAPKLALCCACLLCLLHSGASRRRLVCNARPFVLGHSSRRRARRRHRQQQLDVSAAAHADRVQQRRIVGQRQPAAAVGCEGGRVGAVAGAAWVEACCHVMQARAVPTMCGMTAVGSKGALRFAGKQLACDRAFSAAPLTR